MESVVQNAQESMEFSKLQNETKNTLDGTNPINSLETNGRIGREDIGKGTSPIALKK